MNIGVFTKPNEKGQIVIPKEMREKLSIDKNLLEKTKGTWADEDFVGITRLALNG